MDSYQYSFEKLDVWKNARLFVVDVYKLTGKFPKEEIYCLTSQIERAVVSIVSNIAEGSSRISLKEQIRYTEISYGSALEVYCQLIIALDLKYISKTDFQEMNKKIKIITIQLNALKNSQIKRLNEKYPTEINSSTHINLSTNE